MKAIQSNIDKVSSVLWDRTFSKWYSGNDMVFIKFKISYNVSKDEIIRLLSKGYDVRTGYVCTQIKGAHQYFIAYK